MRSRAYVPASRTASCPRCGQTDEGGILMRKSRALDPLLRRTKMLKIAASKHYDAIVIGGGPSGSTTALMLARAGWAVALVEKSQFPRPKVCGEFISASTFPLLAEFGLLDDVRGLAGPEIRRVDMFRSSGEAVSTSDMPVVSGHIGKWGRALGREHFRSSYARGCRQSGRGSLATFSCLQYRTLEPRLAMRNQ